MEKIKVKNGECSFCLIKLRNKQLEQWMNLQADNVSELEKYIDSLQKHIIILENGYFKK